jgi:hypothetical protein
MSSIQNSELLDFQQFILAQIQSDEPPASPEDCLSRYRALYPSSTELAESLGCLEKAFEQKSNGKGRAFGEFDADFRKRNSL